MTKIKKKIKGVRPGQRIIRDSGLGFKIPGDFIRVSGGSGRVKSETTRCGCNPKRYDTGKAWHQPPNPHVQRAPTASASTPAPERSKDHAAFITGDDSGTSRTISSTAARCGG